jgi:hypothetical protein
MTCSMRYAWRSNTIPCLRIRKNNMMDDSEVAEVIRLNRDLVFLKKRVAELVCALEEANEDNTRLFFVGVNFGKSVEHFGSKSNYHFDKNVLHDAVRSTNMILANWFGEETISDYEADMIATYINRVHRVMTSLSDEEREKGK